jgi:ABC-type branched-subunit amino acid transport system ATPase component
MGGDDLPALRFSGVSKKFGAITALNDLTFDVRRGGFYCTVWPKLGRQNNDIALNMCTGESRLWNNRNRLTGPNTGAGP